MTFDAWKEGKVGPSTHDLIIVAKIKPEPVSSRLKRVLIHPQKNRALTGLRFSPDGTQMIAVVGISQGTNSAVVWDVSTGKQLVKIDVVALLVNGDLFVSPDWKTMFISSRQKIDEAKDIKQDGKRVYRHTYQSDVRAWNLVTGKLLRTYASTDQILECRLAPDATSFLTWGEVSEEMTDAIGKLRCRLWNTKTGNAQPLPDDAIWPTIYSPDSQLLAMTLAKKNVANAVKVMDAASGKEKWSVPMKTSRALVKLVQFSSNGRLLAGICGPKAYGSGQELVLWEAASGREFASLAADKGCSFRCSGGYSPYCCFAPDSHTLAALGTCGDMTSLFLYSIGEKQAPRVVPLIKEVPRPARLKVDGPVFSPDGKQVAVLTQVIGRPSRDGTGQHQYRIHFIEVAAGQVRDVLIAPHGYSGPPCFSPDGKILASGGNGRVLLWDVAKRSAAEK